MKSKQVNNLKIRYSKLYGKWQVKSPYGIILEEFRRKADAIAYAKRTKDFVRR